MNIIKEADLRKELKSSPAPAYLFFGEEDYMKSYAVAQARSLISPDETLAFFNEMKFDALSYSPDALLEAMMPLPMGADRKLIVVSGIDLGSMKQNEVDALCGTLSRLEEYDYNTVIINVPADRFDPGYLPKKPSATLQKLAEVATPVIFEKNSPARLAAWIQKHYEHNGLLATEEVCRLTCERCGRDMYRLANETDKISYFVLSQGRERVEPRDVTEISSASAEYDAFAFTNAVCTRSKDAALSILADLKLRRADPLYVIGEISRSVCDMCAVSALTAEGKTSGEISRAIGLHEYRVSLIQKNRIPLEVCERMLSLCSAADKELKGGSLGFGPIEKLICTI